MINISRWWLTQSILIIRVVWFWQSVTFFPFSSLEKSPAVGPAVFCDYFYNDTPGQLGRQSRGGQTSTVGATPFGIDLSQPGNDEYVVTMVMSTLCLSVSTMTLRSIPSIVWYYDCFFNCRQKEDPLLNIFLSYCTWAYYTHYVAFARLIKRMWFCVNK